MKPGEVEIAYSIITIITIIMIIFGMLSSRKPRTQDSGWVKGRSITIFVLPYVYS